MSDEKCKTKLGTWRCKFVERMDRLPPSPEAIQAVGALDMAGWDMRGAVESLAGSETYVCDVCTACGKQVLRPSGVRE